MHRSSSEDDKTTVAVQIPWNPLTARAFLIAVVTTFGLLCLFLITGKPEPDVRVFKNKTIPIELLNFGNGDGTGVSKGNLTPEGNAHKGKLPSSDLADAEIASKTTPSKTNALTDINQSSNIVAKAEISSNDNSANTGTSSQNIGSPDGITEGSGLGSRGGGKGKGEGFGDIEWGGGGNRVVLSKKVPLFPPGVNTSAQIKIRFTVRPDGTVSSMVPLQKADPRLERAAMDALRQWRFNPLKDERDMVGIIPFTFKLR